MPMQAQSRNLKKLIQHFENVKWTPYEEPENPDLVDIAKLEKRKFCNQCLGRVFEI